MSRGNKNSAATVAARREQIWRLAVRGCGHRQILEGFRRQGKELSQATLERDLQAIRRDLFSIAQASELYSLKKAFAELEELWREAWGLYSRPQVEIETKKGLIKLDDRGIKTLLLRELRGIVHERAQMLGYFTPKVLERITLMETVTGRGIQIERIPWDEQLRRGTEELKNNEGLARSQGITDQTLPEGSAV
jgi:hypothetical protein